MSKHVVVKLFSHIPLFGTPWTAARQASLSFTISQSLLKVMSIESVMPSSHLISVVPFSSCPQSLPASGSFPVRQLLASGARVNTSALTRTTSSELPWLFSGKESACQSRRQDSTPRSGRSPGGGCGNPLQYSCL